MRVRAAGVDRGVCHLVTDLPHPVRLAGYGVWARSPARCGSAGRLRMDDEDLVVAQATAPRSTGAPTTTTGPARSKQPASGT